MYAAGASRFTHTRVNVIGPVRTMFKLGSCRPVFPRGCVTPCLGGANHHHSVEDLSHAGIALSCGRACDQVPELALGCPRFRRALLGGRTRCPRDACLTHILRRQAGPSEPLARSRPRAVSSAINEGGRRWRHTKPPPSAHIPADWDEHHPRARSSETPRTGPRAECAFQRAPAPAQAQEWPR
jgi:hypothetical protein